jgi:ABC-type branched-subunit amino acid transport system substrate-binding protein
MNLYESTEDEGLKTAIDQAIQDFLYNEAELDFVENYYSIVRPSFKPMVLNALAYRLHEAGQEENLRAIIQEYDQENDSVPDKVRRFYDPDNPPRKVLDEELRIALMLPFHAYSYVDGLTSKARQAINFYAGVKQALDTLRFPGVRGVKLRTFDTQQDSVLAAKLMNDEVATFQPDIIIGGFYNGPSMAIAKYSDEHNIPQIIPFSNAPRLVRNTEQVLLANSLIKTRGKKLAEVIATQAMVNRLLIVSDQSTTSRTLAETVADYLDKTGTATARIDLAAQRKPAEVVQRLKAAPKSAGGRFDGLFLPLLSEHKANLILQQLRQADLRLALFGVKDFQYFQAVDPAVLYRYKMIFPTNYYPRNDSIHEPRFTANYKFAYGDRPSREARQGYDIIRWLLHAYGLNSDQGTIRKALVQARQFQGLNQDYHLEPGHRDNQAVQILQFWNNEIREYQGWRQSNTER